MFLNFLDAYWLGRLVLRRLRAFLFVVPVSNSY